MKCLDLVWSTDFADFADYIKGYQKWRRSEQLEISARYDVRVGVKLMASQQGYLPGAPKNRKSIFHEPQTHASPQRSPDYDDTSGWKLLSNAVGVKTSTFNLPS